MAIGLARMFGFEFLENFDYPYVSRSVQEFWRRWHISLSNWFRDYLYIPLGGSRRGAARTYFNLVMVFLLCGLWHGAAWSFVVWGAIHGFLLVVERAGLGRHAREGSPEPREPTTSGERPGVGGVPLPDNRGRHRLLRRLLRPMREFSRIYRATSRGWCWRARCSVRPGRSRG